MTLPEFSESNWPGLIIFMVGIFLISLMAIPTSTSYRRHQKIHTHHPDRTYPYCQYCQEGLRLARYTAGLLRSARRRDSERPPTKNR